MVILVRLFGVKFLEDAVHALGVELEVGRDPLDPSLVHLVEACPNDVPNFEIKERALLVEVDFYDVGDQQQGELHFFGLVILLQPGSYVRRLVDVVV